MQKNVKIIVRILYCQRILLHW